jgi:hypothetical protein
MSKDRSENAILTFISTNNKFKGKVSKYAHVTLTSTFSATHCTKIKARKLRVKDELMFLYIKKQRLDQILYQIHLVS